MQSLIYPDLVQPQQVRKHELVDFPSAFGQRMIVGQRKARTGVDPDFGPATSTAKPRPSTEKKRLLRGDSFLKRYDHAGEEQARPKRSTAWVPEPGVAQHPFPRAGPPETGQIAFEVINPYGNEVPNLSEGWPPVPNRRANRSLR